MIGGKWLAWPFRWAQTKGFGVQSPWAYDFIRNVVEEKSPYYAYDDLRETLRAQSKTEQRLSCLLFRLANYWQPKTIWLYGEDSATYAPFLHRGSLKATLKQADSVEALGSDGCTDMVVLATKSDATEAFRRVLQQADNRTMVVLVPIYINKVRRKLWKTIRNDARCTATFDLYDGGIIFFDSKRYKHNYKINL